MTHEVIRPYPGSGLTGGSFVDASGWRNVRQLERLNYIRPLTTIAETVDATAVVVEGYAPKKRRGR